MELNNISLGLKSLDTAEAYLDSFKYHIRRKFLEYLISNNQEKVLLLSTNIKKHRCEINKAFT